jgi:type II secretory pathway component GspD/PulD (secretin)
MTLKTTGQRAIGCRTKDGTTGEMKITLLNATRVGALQKSGSTAYRLSRLFATLALASLACFAPAQDDAAPAADAAETTATAEGASADTGEGVTVVASNLPIERVLGQLSDQAKVPIAARGKTVGEKVTLIQPKKLPLRDALNQLVNSKPNWILYEPPDRPGTYEIWDQETYKAEVLPRLVRPKVFVPKEITAEEAAKALEGVMTPGIGKVAFDPRSNKVIMTDLVPVLELAQRLLQTIDVQFYTRVYSIEHADVNAVAEKLSALKSPAAPDIQVDERTRQIIASDRIEILQKMEQLVQTLDIGPEMRVYSINNLGVEGEELEELETAIEEILTPDAYYHFNVRQGKLIVRDLPEVQERVEKVLEAFDAPVRQILLQLEIIETEFSDGFNWSVDYAFSGDLLGAVTDGLVSGIPTGGTTGSDGKPVEGSEGFVNFRKEFPVVEAGSKGLNAQMLTNHAFIKLQAAMSDSRTRILQQPRMLVENQKLASFDVGQSVPFFTGGSIGITSTGGVNNLTPSQPVQQLLQVGLFVECTPIISANGLVELEITVENSSPLRVDQTFAGQSYTGMGKTNQTLETTMWVPSGATRVIGGLVTDSKSETRSGIPGLMKIPVIGPALFGSYTKNPEDNRRRNLLIFITPTIVEETPSNPQKYKGVIMADLPQEALTTPTATISDIGTFSQTTQLEKGDYLSYTPPPLPDFQAMSRTATDDGHVLLSPPPSAHEDAPPSLSGIDATVNIQSTPPGDLDTAAPEAIDGVPVPDGTTGLSSRAVAPGTTSMSTLPRVSLQETPSTDSLASLITTAGPSGLLSTGSQNLVKPPAPKATPAAAAAAAAAPAAKPGTPAAPAAGGPPPPATATPPSRETNHR